LSQEDVARLAGVSVRTVGRIERGEDYDSPRTLADVLESLDIAERQSESDSGSSGMSALQSVSDRPVAAETPRVHTVTNRDDSFDAGALLASLTRPQMEALMRAVSDITLLGEFTRRLAQAADDSSALDAWRQGEPSTRFAARTRPTELDDQ
jgi:transcriptional regulator with XRE-family HTH domain